MSLCGVMSTEREWSQNSLLTEEHEIELLLTINIIISSALVQLSCHFVWMYVISLVNIHQVTWPIKNLIDHGSFTQACLIAPNNYNLQPKSTPG